MDDKIKDLQIFCDSCGEQNKNYRLFKSLHHLIYFKKKLDASGNILFMVVKKHQLQKWMDVIESAKVKPHPFVVEQVQQHHFRFWEKHLNPLYKQKCPFPSRPIREIRFSIDHPRLVFFRETFNGSWQFADLIGKAVKTKARKEFSLPNYLNQSMVSYTS